MKLPIYVANVKDFCLPGVKYHNKPNNDGSRLGAIIYNELNGKVEVDVIVQTMGRANDNEFCVQTHKYRKALGLDADDGEITRFATIEEIYKHYPDLLGYLHPRFYTVTDPDTKQRCLEIKENQIYYFSEERVWHPGDKHNKKQMINFDSIIDLSTYSDLQIDDTLDTFGYKRTNEDVTPALIAECLFEMEV